jgi:4-hydroxybenzoate polyprenyltransferase
VSTLQVSPARRRPPGWLRLLRPHYAPITLGFGLAGMVVGNDGATTASLAVGLAICLLGYGLGQIINDYVDREADAINAPDRPLVTGEVNANAALATSSVVIAALVVAALVVAPPIAVWLGVAVVGHLMYTATKAVPMVGNLVNGADVATFALIGAAAAAPERSAFDLPSAVLVNAGLLALVATGFGMVTYFKDIPGDTAVGYRTFVVAMGARRARLLPPAFPLLAVAIAAALAVADPGALGVGDAGPAFWLLLLPSAAAFAVGSRQLLAAPEANAFTSLGWYTRGVVWFAFALGAAHEPLLAVLVLVPVAAFLELALRDALYGAPKPGLASTTNGGT